MNTPEKEEKLRQKMSPTSGHDQKQDISLTRKILIGIFILGFWVFFYWFRKP